MVYVLIRGFVLNCRTGRTARRPSPSPSSRSRGLAALSIEARQIVLVAAVGAASGVPPVPRRRALRGLAMCVVLPPSRPSPASTPARAAAGSCRTSPPNSAGASGCGRYFSPEIAALLSGDRRRGRPRRDPRGDDAVQRSARLHRTERALSGPQVVALLNSATSDMVARCSRTGARSTSISATASWRTSGRRSPPPITPSVRSAARSPCKRG